MNSVLSSSVPSAELELIRSAGRVATRYAAYPPLAAFRADCDVSGNGLPIAPEASPDAPLSIYVHMPFCHTSCAFCSCHKIVTRDGGKAARYLDFLAQDVRARAASRDDGRRVRRMYWGGGTPTYYTTAQLARAWAQVRESFPCDEDGEYTIEIDPRTVNEAAIGELRAMGFNIAALGIPDLAAPVLDAVTRLQTAEQSLEAVDAARRTGFRTVSVDVMYGLPRQTTAGFVETVAGIVSAGPDRILLHDYVHAPRRHKTQRQMSFHELPRPVEKLEMLGLAVERLEAAGYRHLGPDCFVRPADPLAVAQEAQTLQFDMLGYSAAATAEVVPAGVSAVGATAYAYTQNEVDLGRYYDRVGSGVAPVARGVAFSPDDLVRRAAMRALLCEGRISHAVIERQYSVAFERYFAHELKHIERYAAAGLVRLESRQTVIEPRGRLWVRNLCALFDRYRDPARAPAAQGG